MVRYTSKDYPIGQHRSRLTNLTRWTAYATSDIQRFKERAVAEREFKIKKLAAAMHNESARSPLPAS
jgi:splicing factor 3A subunit 3